MRCSFSIALLGIIFGARAAAAALDIPFDFSRRAIGIDATIHGIPLYVLLDTGVDPSVISTARAESLRLKVDRASRGEASGYGDAESARVFSAIIDGLAIGGRAFPQIDALAADTAGISRQYGRDIDGVLGYSFLKDKIVLIDYTAHTVTILDRATGSDSRVRRCLTHWNTAMQFLGGDNTPIISHFRFGSVAGPVTLDTGSNGGIGLFDRAFDSPVVVASARETGEIEHAGARGNAKSKTYTFEAPVGFGPFSLPAGQLVDRIKAGSRDDARFANVGNQLFADMNLKILLDYRAKKLTFYGNCAVS